MADLREALSELRSDDVRVDHLGRVVITAPSINEKIREIGRLEFDEAASPTNIICCGNGSCAGGEDLGALVERFSRGQLGSG